MYTTLIEPHELAAHLGNPDWAILDCRFDLARPAWGADSLGPVTSPVHSTPHLERDLSGRGDARDRAAPAAGRRRRSPPPSGASGSTRTCRWSPTTRGRGRTPRGCGGSLRWLGHRAVAVLNGGLAAWQRAGLPVSTADEQRAPRRLRAAAGRRAHRHQQRDRRLACERGARARRAAAGRRPQRRPLRGRERDPRPGRRPRPRRAQPSIRA